MQHRANELMRTAQWDSTLVGEQAVDLQPPTILIPIHRIEDTRLDCDREASHNLNRLLDGPGGSELGAMQIYL